MNSLTREGREESSVQSVTWESLSQAIVFAPYRLNDVSSQKLADENITVSSLISPKRNGNSQILIKTRYGYDPVDNQVNESNDVAWKGDYTFQLNENICRVKSIDYSEAKMGSELSYSHHEKTLFAGGYRGFEVYDTLALYNGYKCAIVSITQKNRKRDGMVQYVNVAYIDTKKNNAGSSSTVDLASPLFANRLDKGLFETETFQESIVMRRFLSGNGADIWYDPVTGHMNVVTDLGTFFLRIAIPRLDNNPIPKTNVFYKELNTTGRCVLFPIEIIDVQKRGKN